MTHEAGLEAAHDAYADGELISKAIQAYLSASGMVLVPREPTDEMIKRMNRYMNEPDRSDFGAMILKNVLKSAPDPFKSNP